MKRIIAILVGVVLVGFAGLAIYATRDGELVTPEGDGLVTLEAGTFEAFTLPDYAAAFVGPDYKSYFVEVEPGIKIHILEVGEGYPVYLQHGNPTSGFLYRKVAAELPLDRVRVIMPTLVGLGFSSKVPASEQTLDNHIRWMNAALTQLQLEELVYAGQDWGGPVGMGALERSPDLLKGMVAMNTIFNAPRQERDLSTAHATVKTPVVGELLLEVFSSVFDVIDDFQGDPASISEGVRELYARPVFESGNAKAPVAQMRMVPDGPDHPSAEQMRAIEAYVGTLDIPVELVWGMKDPIIGRGLEPMKLNFPDARVTETQAGHFLQEEVPVEIAEALMRVVDQVEAQSASEGGQADDEGGVEAL